MTRSRFAGRAGTILLLAFAAALAAGLAIAQKSKPDFPEPTAHVVDAAGLLRPETREHLEAVCRELREKTGAEIAVALVPSIAPLSVEEYAVKLFERWGVGRKKENDGVLMVVARDERRVRFEVGYGLEGLLPDGRVGGILRREVVPHLRENDWDGGVKAGVETLASIIAQDRGVTLTTLGPRPSEEPAADESRRPIPGLLFLLAFFVIGSLIVAASTSSARRRRRGGYWWPGGGWGGGGFGGGGFGGGSSGGGGFGGFGGGSGGGGGASSGF